VKKLRFGIVLCSAILACTAIYVHHPAPPPLSSSPAAAEQASVEANSQVPVASRATPARVSEQQARLGTAPVSEKLTLGLPELPAAPQATPEAPAFPGTRVDPQVLRALHGTEPLNAKHPHVAAAIAVQEKYTNWLMAQPAVVGTAVGLNDEGRVAIVVLTRSSSSDLPAVLEQIPVVSWTSGDVYALNHPAQDEAEALGRVAERAKSSGARSVPVQQTRFTHPVPIGVSTSLPTVYTQPYITAGTLGCRVTDGTNVYALSNNHVFANESTAPKGASVLQPGTYDKGVDADFYGTLDRWSSIDFSSSASNKVDAAVAVSDAGSLGKATPAGGYGTPSSSIVPDDTASLGTALLKYGRTTGQTSASLSALNATVTVGYDTGNARFVGQVVIWGRGFSAGGDSGSLIVQKSDKKAVGLLFAGSNTTTFGNPIGAVLGSFGVTIDGQ